MELRLRWKKVFKQHDTSSHFLRGDFSNRMEWLMFIAKKVYKISATRWPLLGALSVIIKFRPILIEQVVKKPLRSVRSLYCTVTRQFVSARGWFFKPTRPTRELSDIRSQLCSYGVAHDIKTMHRSVQRMFTVFGRTAGAFVLYVLSSLVEPPAELTTIIDKEEGLL